jgi:hypothetical protein
LDRNSAAPKFERGKQIFGLVRSDRATGGYATSFGSKAGVRLVLVRPHRLKA